MRRAPLLLALIALTASACGSDEKQIDGVVREYVSGIGEGDGKQVCGVLAGPYQREVLGPPQYEGGCEDRVEQYSDDFSEEERRAFEETEIEVKLTGKETALVRTKSPSPNEDFVADAAYNMRKFDDGWKIESNNELEALE